MDDGISPRLIIILTIQQQETLSWTDQPLRHERGGVNLRREEDAAGG